MKRIAAVNDCHFGLSHSINVADMTFDFHAHDEFEILYFMNGEVQYYIEDESYTLVPGDLLLIPPGKLHRLVTVDETVAYERMVLSLSVEYGRRLLERVPSHFVHAPLGRCWHLPLGEHDADIRKMFEKLLAQSADNTGLLQRDVTVTLLLLELQRYVTTVSEQGVGSSHRMSEIIRYINAHFTEDLTLEAIADRFYISQCHLLRQFKKYTNSTVHRYILQKRLLLAKAMLRDGVSPQQVSEQCGWKSYVGFYRAFVQETGQKPSACR